jgi:hypothetical protein
VTWTKVEQVSLGASTFFAFASTVIGFRWVASPYFRGYASAAGAFFLLGRFAAGRRPCAADTGSLSRART